MVFARPHVSHLQTNRCRSARVERKDPAIPPAIISEHPTNPSAPESARRNIDGATLGSVVTGQIQHSLLSHYFQHQIKMGRTEAKEAVPPWSAWLTDPSTSETDVIAERKRSSTHAAKVQVKFSKTHHNHTTPGQLPEGPFKVLEESLPWSSIVDSDSHFSRSWRRLAYIERRGQEVVTTLSSLFSCHCQVSAVCRLSAPRHSADFGLELIKYRPCFWRNLSILDPLPPSSTTVPPHISDIDLHPFPQLHCYKDIHSPIRPTWAIFESPVTSATGSWSCVLQRAVSLP